MPTVSSPHPLASSPDPIGSVCVPDHERIDSLENRLGVLESQHAWLRIEQLEAELARQAKLIAYIINRDYGEASA